MIDNFNIRTLQETDIDIVTNWAAKEGFAPGLGDVNIYRNTDSQGLWVGCLGSLPIGCIAGVKYNQSYGFVGLFIVERAYRGKGYGVKLWKHVLNNLDHIKCLGLEAAPNRLDDYKKWGFIPSSLTTRWKVANKKQVNKMPIINEEDFFLIDGSNISSDIIQKYDENKENTPRPHFLSDWLTNKSGKVFVMMNSLNKCVGFARVRPCMLKTGNGFRIGPLIADSPVLASTIINNIIAKYDGIILIDSPGINIESNKLFRSLGFIPISHTVRMYKGSQPPLSMRDVYGLACLELG